MSLHFDISILNKPSGFRTKDDAVDYLQVTDGLNGWIVADGLGEYCGSEIAARLAVDSFISDLRSEDRLTSVLLLKLLISMHLLIRQRQQADPRLESMRAKVALLLSDGHQALWAHSGDVRLYFFREGRILHQTKDHSLAQALADQGEIRLTEIRCHPDRHQLTSLLGVTGDIKPTLASRLEVLQPDDALLLCSDGFWEQVPETVMLAELAKTYSPSSWLRGMETRLLEQVPDTHDSYAAIAVFVRP